MKIQIKTPNGNTYTGTKFKLTKDEAIEFVEDLRRNELSYFKFEAYEGILIISGELFKQCEILIIE